VLFYDVEVPTAQLERLEWMDLQDSLDFPEVKDKLEVPGSQVSVD